MLQIRAVCSALGMDELKLPSKEPFEDLRTENNVRLSHEKIIQIINNSNMLKYKALTSFLACTGIRIGDMEEKEINELNNQLQKNEITQEQFETLKNKISYVHPHAFRRYFISMVGNYCNNLKAGALLKGHSLPKATDKHYVEFTKKELWEHYKQVMPYLSFKEEIKIRTITDKELNLLEDLQKRMDAFEGKNLSVSSDEAAEMFKNKKNIMENYAGLTVMLLE